MTGGIRDAETLERALATGCRRVNLGTAALEDPEWTARAIAEHGDRVAVGLDVRGTTLAARGWTREGGDLWEALARLDAEGAPGTSSPTSPRTACCRARTSPCSETSVRARTGRSSHPAGCRPSRTSSRSAGWSSTAWRARSSARRSTGGPSRSPRRSTRQAARDGPITAGHGGLTDSARVPWAGRELSPTGFEGDTGAADPALLRALSTPGDDVALMRAVEAGRFVVPIVAEPTEVDTSGEHAVDSRSTSRRSPSSPPTASAPSPPSPGSRPSPRGTPRPPGARHPCAAGQAAVAEGCDVIVVDVAGPSTRVLRPSMVWALAQQRPWEPPHTDPSSSQRRAAVRDEDDVTAHELEEGNPRGEGVLGVVLDLRPGLAPRRCAPSPPGSASGSPPTASCAPGSTGSPSASADPAPADRRWSPAPFVPVTVSAPTTNFSRRMPGRW